MTGRAKIEDDVIKISEWSDKYCLRAAATRTGLIFWKFQFDFSRRIFELQRRLKNQNVRLDELNKFAKDRIQFAPRVEKLWQKSYL